ncbi:MAG TPA: carbamoyl-phosphate synthase large subunit [Phycisphaerales bacterium]|nr:carbamoyl-phosphate synthase large subunit [Phycisphaerales bacterium]
MPKRTDIKTILVLGSGPIVIGQGCEFDYSGTQACKALRSEGYRIVLVNSNPATIMTDPAFSDRTYIEPITPESVRKIIQKENARGPRIDAVLPTLGGQTALNCACALWDDGTLKEFGVEMIGASREVIHRAEDRQLFKDICEKIGLRLPKAKTVTSLADAETFLQEIGLPAIIRPAFTLGGTGGGIAYNREEFVDIVQRGLRASMIGQVQIDQSVIGWKEFELEVVRDKKDNCIIVCGIENIDPMGVHTGDSITVAPILTLTDKEYQAMRDAAIAIMRAVGVETGGSNVQFAVNPDPAPGPDGRKPFEMVVVEMNPRVSRSSALASKATGFPIAKIAAKLAVGYTLDELRNDITGTTSACFEPTIDYCVVKMPRWTFEKFPEADETLTTQMKSVGEAMAIGRTFKEALQKAIRSMEVKRFGLGLDRNDKWLAAMRAVEHDQLVLDVMGAAAPPRGDRAEGQAAEGAAAADTGLRTADGQPIEWPIALDKLSRKLAVPSQGRLYYIRYAFKMGWSVERVNALTNIDPWFLDQIRQLVEFEDTLCDSKRLEDVPREVLFEAKQLGYSDAQLANLYFGKLTTETILAVRARRRDLGVTPVFKQVDTCAAEFEAITPYYYSTYESGVRHSGSGVHARVKTDAESRIMNPAEDEVRVSEKRKVVIIGGGPNRIGQGIEFDYCCVHASYAAREMGFESVMINSNPETVSTDYDTSDLLFFEPLTLEDTLNVIERLNGAPFWVAGHVFDKDQSISGDVLARVAAALREKNIGQSVVVAGPALRVPNDEVWVTPDEHSIWAWNRSTRGVRAVDRGEFFAAGGSLEDLDDAWACLHDSEDRVHGVIVQFGGQTPLNLAKGLVAAGVPIIGTSVDSIDRAEDRKRFDEVLDKLKLQRPAAGIAHSLDEALREARRIGYPVLIRPSYVLGGRGMEVCYDEAKLRAYITTALKQAGLDDAPVLIDKFLDGAVEVDVDVVADFGGRNEETGRQRDGVKNGSAVIAGVLEQIEQAGIHSGDSACTLPPASLPPPIVERIEDLAISMARELEVRGLMNLQLAVKDGEIYVLEVNPRASRTVPFVAKATHTPWPAIAAKVMIGMPLREALPTPPRRSGAPGYWAVKESVFPFSKFPGVDVVLGPEMRSTGEVMGIDPSLPIAFAKSQISAGQKLPTDPAKGGVFVSVRDSDRDGVARAASILARAGFTLYATSGTGSFLTGKGVPVTILQKIGEGARPNVLDLMQNGQIAMVINTPTRTGWQTDEGRIRANAVRLNIPMISTATAAVAAAHAIDAIRTHGWTVAALQDYAPQVAGDGLPEVPRPARAVT